jgi:hypothetical protein
MSDKTEQYIKLLKRHSDRLFIAALYLLLGIMVFLYFREQGSQIGISEDAGKPAQLSDPVVNNVFFKKIDTMSKPQSLADPQFNEIQQVAQFNMFDHKAVKDKQEIERQADQRFASAETAAAAGQKEEAIRLLNEILRQIPSHKRAKELLEKLRPSTAAGATTSTITKP